MVTRHKQLIRVVFDVLDENKKNISLDRELSVTARDPDEAIEAVFAQIQRQLNRSDIRLSRVRICA